MPIAEWGRYMAHDLQRRLQLPAELFTRLADVRGAAVELPSDESADTLLEQLGVEPADRAATLAARPDPSEHPELWWLLEHSHDLLLQNMGTPPAQHRGWPALPDETGPVGRHLYVWTYLTVAPHVRTYHSAIGLTTKESAATLAALGAELTSSRRLTGRHGLDPSWGLPLVFTGVSLRLGRLAFDRTQPRPNHPFLAPAESGLGTHIPSGGGPLTASACDRSFARAIDVSRHLPDNVVAFGCHSWLMDSQLADYLPTESNIIRFQRRFKEFVDRERADWAPIEHVFERRFDGPVVPADLLAGLPQETTLQRAIVTHLRRGGHWYNQTGWFRI